MCAVHTNWFLDPTVPINLFQGAISLSASGIAACIRCPGTYTASHSSPYILNKGNRDSPHCQGPNKQKLTVDYGTEQRERVCRLCLSLGTYAFIPMHKPSITGNEISDTNMYVYAYTAPPWHYLKLIFRGVWGLRLLISSVGLYLRRRGHLFAVCLLGG